jgi:hypothetical protein
MLKGKQRLIRGNDFHQRSCVIDFLFVFKRQPLLKAPAHDDIFEKMNPFHLSPIRSGLIKFFGKIIGVGRLRSVDDMLKLKSRSMFEQKMMNFYI